VESGRATSGDASGVPSEQRIAGSNPAGRAGQSVIGGVTDAVGSRSRRLARASPLALT